ncbi:MAG TPA: efflux RND transporter periplasmic adaptor subunit [Candidatus Eisenbacteria bacterium]
MAEVKPGGRAGGIRRVVLAVVLAGIAFLVWRQVTRREGYTGGDVVTTGTVQAVHVDLAFKVPGRIADVPVAEGDDVQAGQLVGTLETQDLDVQVASARSALALARASAAQARANHAKAVRDLQRQRELMQADATTQQQLDAAESAEQVSAAQLEAAMAQIGQAENALTQAQFQRSYAELHASAAGQVSDKVHNPGEVVAVGAPVVTLSQLDTVKVLAPVDETRVGAVRPGDKVRVRVYTFDKRQFDGEVTDIQPAGEFATRKDWGAQRRDIRTFTVTARVPNPERLLKDGMTAEVTIVVSPGVRQPTVAHR